MIRILTLFHSSLFHMAQNGFMFLTFILDVFCRWFWSFWKLWESSIQSRLFCYQYIVGLYSLNWFIKSKMTKFHLFTIIFRPIFDWKLAINLLMQSTTYMPGGSNKDFFKIPERTLKVVWAAENSSVKFSLINIFCSSLCLH